jgi:hypothetical protein
MKGLLPSGRNEQPQGRHLAARATRTGWIERARPTLYGRHQTLLHHTSLSVSSSLPALGCPGLPAKSAPPKALASDAALAHFLCKSLLLGSLQRRPMVSGSLARQGAKAVGEAVGAGGWSYEQIIKHLSPAVSKFSVRYDTMPAPSSLTSTGEEHAAGATLGKWDGQQALPPLPSTAAAQTFLRLLAHFGMHAARGGGPGQRILCMDHRRAEAPGLCLRHRWVFAGFDLSSPCSQSPSA